MFWRALSVFVMCTLSVCMAVNAGDCEEVFEDDSLFAAGDSPQGIALAHFDGDDFIDAAVANHNSDGITILLNDGNGGFVAGQTLPASDLPRLIVAADLDGNGATDIATTNKTGNFVSVYLNQCGLTFAGPTTLPTGNGPHDIAAADLDNDGSLDLVCSNDVDDTISVFMNQGSGSFGVQQVFATGDRPRGIAVADLNGDGAPDIATANFLEGSGGNVSILLNDGSGNFNNHDEYPVGTDPTDVAIGDLNNDHSPDLAVSNFSSRDASVLFNDGDGTFTLTGAFNTGIDPIAIEIGDVTNDGLADLIVVNGAFSGGGEHVSIMSNLGAGQFQEIEELVVGTDPLELAIGPLDTGSTIDLIVCNADSDNVSVLLNQCPDPPIINMQPVSTVAEIGGPLVGLDVVADKATGYQWRLDGQPISDGPNFFGTSTSTLTIAPNHETEGAYDVVIMNGSASTISDSAVVAVRNSCPSDLTLDDTVNVEDLLQLLADWGNCD